MMRRHSWIKLCTLAAAIGMVFVFGTMTRVNADAQCGNNATCMDPSDPSACANPTSSCNGGLGICCPTTPTTSSNCPGTCKASCAANESGSSATNCTGSTPVCCQGNGATTCPGTCKATCASGEIATTAVNCTGSTGVCCQTTGAVKGSATTLVNPLGAATLYTVINRVISTWLGLVGAFALLVFFYAGVRYMTATDEKAVHTAKQAMLYATIGLIIIVLAFTISNSLINFVAKSST